jgi:hypothetical protein
MMSRSAGSMALSLVFFPDRGFISFKGSYFPSSMMTL